MLWESIIKIMISREGRTYCAHTNAQTFEWFILVQLVRRWTVDWTYLGAAPAPKPFAKSSRTHTSAVHTHCHSGSHPSRQPYHWKTGPSRSKSGWVDFPEVSDVLKLTLKALQDRVFFSFCWLIFLNPTFLLVSELLWLTSLSTTETLGSLCVRLFG